VAVGKSLRYDVLLYCSLLVTADDDTLIITQYNILLIDTNGARWMTRLHNNLHLHRSGSKTIEVPAAAITGAPSLRAFFGDPRSRISPPIGTDSAQ